MMNSLIEIPFQEWPKIRDLYVERKRDSCSYNLLQNYIKWKTKNSDLNVKLYALNGEWEQDGTFVMQEDDVIYINTLDNNLERLITAVQCLDVKQKYSFCGIPERLLTVIEKYFEFSKCKEIYKPVGTYWYHATADKINQLQNTAPRGISVKPLSLEHVETIFSIWPHRNTSKIDFIKQLIDCNDNIGAFDEYDNLLAWCLILPLGSLGVLQVTEANKRKGLGSLMIQEISKIISAQNIEVTAPVVFENIASRGMFEKSGFSIIDKVYWIFKPAQEAK